jgi:transcriptional regulator with XRE-family HTH domain
MRSRDLPSWLQQNRWAVGARIRDLRTDANLSQVQLGEQAQLDHKTISRYENGVRNLGIDEAALIARALGVPLSHLFPGERPPGPAGG